MMQQATHNRLVPSEHFETVNELSCPILLYQY
jgi:hypothetical protein